VRPGDRLVLFSLETVRKLAVSVGDRRFFVPLNHPSSAFRLLHVTSTTARCSLHQLVSDSNDEFPLTIELTEHGNYVNCCEQVLPSQTLLKAEVQICVTIRSKCDVLILSLHYLVKCRSRCSTVCNNEFILGSACFLLENN